MLFEVSVQDSQVPKRCLMLQYFELRCGFFQFGTELLALEKNDGEEKMVRTHYWLLPELSKISKFY